MVSNSHFDKVPTANPVFYRTYSRRKNNERESWDEVCDRTTKGLARIGHLTLKEQMLIFDQQQKLKSLVSGRFLWVGGTEWSERPDNYPGVYNCSSTNVDSWDAFGYIMDVTMMGCGAGAVLEEKYISQIPPITNLIDLKISSPIGIKPVDKRNEETSLSINGNVCTIAVGDSRRGWVEGYQALLELSSNTSFSLYGNKVEVHIDLSNVRPTGERLKGFGGVSCPDLLPQTFINCGKVLNKAIGRQLNSVECCLLIDHAALAIVSGNIRRCIAYGEKVSTASGLKPIQDIEIGDLVLTSSGRYMPVVNKFIQGVQKTVEIETASTSIRCTPNHKVAIYDGLDSWKWKVASELNQGKDAMIFFPNWEYLTSDHLPDLTKFDWLPQPVSQVIPSKEVETFDIEVEGDHEFVCEGLLVHNSAGMKQGDKHDEIFAVAKDNLWQQTPDGKWVVDPERDALRMANHTRTFHQKPTKQECIDAVRKQYYSGEGAIQWVGEAVARANADLPVDKAIILKAYQDGTMKDLLKEYLPDITEEELTHRMARYGLNPCVSAENWVLTSDGPKQVEELINEPFIAIVHGEEYLSSDKGFWLSGVKPVYKLTTEEGFSIELTGNHKLKKLEDDWVEAQDLKPGDEIVINDHRGYIDEWSLDFVMGEVFDKYEFKLNRKKIYLNHPNKEYLEQVQRHLLWIGLYSTVGPADIADHHQLAIAGSEDMDSFRKLMGWYLKGEIGYLEKDSHIYKATVKSFELIGEKPVYDCSIPDLLYFDCNGIIAHNCGEIIMSDNFCNLAEVHLNMIDPLDFEEQEQAFKAAALSVATLLHHKFVVPRYRKSRELDPIVGVSFTGLFDFFVNAFGVDWLRWWEAGRPDNDDSLIFKRREAEYLAKWKYIVEETIWEYCDRHGLRRPNRCTTLQPAGSKSLLTGASPGWHPPKAQRFIRRITFKKNDPVALACIDCGYNVIPSQSDKDEKGQLLNDPNDPRCTEWLIEIPVAVNWADVPGADQVDIHNFTALAQFDFAMQVQQHYVTHNLSSTIEFRENEIEGLGERIYQAIRDDEGYISAALLARFDDLQTFPRLPFEPIDKETYEQLVKDVADRKVSDCFHEALRKYDFGDMFEAGPAGCDSDKCLIGTINK